MLQSHPSQIMPSPARLGLTNPNSPSLSNPTAPKLSSQNPQHHHHHQQHHHNHPQQQHQQQHHHHQQQQSSLITTTLTATTTTTTTTTTSSSSTLLSLYPPLSRAQSLLLQMASLANKLFEVSPNRSLWLSSFRGSLPNFTPSQPQTLTLIPPPPALDPSPSNPKEILSLFTSLQTQLFESVAELQEILDLQDAKHKIAREIRFKDSALLAFANKTREAERVLDVLVDDYSDYRPKRLKLEGNFDDSCDYSASSSNHIGISLSLTDILAYAHRISYTTFAPPEFGAGQAPLRGALPPAPQEEQMRASQLYNFADLDVGLPKVVKPEEKTVETLIEAPAAAQPAEGNPLVDLAAIQGLIPPQITVPSGWRPGMPVELPTDLPILPPPGWKPGDPVPLPPLDALASKKNEEQQQMRPPVAPMPPKGPEPIQVRFVQLDINPDQDEYSSDYSSEVGSSDDDDED